MNRKLYDWDRLFRRRKFVLRCGVDYACSQAAISQQLRNAASLAGVGVTVVELDDGVAVRVVKKRRHVRRKR